MARETPRQKRITGRVMHEFKHGELKSGRNGKGGKVKSRRQAIAIALEEAGTSRYESDSRNRRNLRRTEKGRRLRDEQDSRNVRASPTSARTGSVRVPARWQVETPAKLRHAHGKRPSRALGNPTDIPGKNFTRGPSEGRSKAAPR